MVCLYEILLVLRLVVAWMWSHIWVSFMKYCWFAILFRVVCHRDLCRLTSTDLERNRIGAHSVSTFISELAVQLPKPVYQTLPLLMGLLENEVGS